MKEQFEIVGSMNDKGSSIDQNTVSHFRNNLAGIIGDQAVLPKFILIVPDNDIIRYFWYREHDTQEGYARLLKWLMSQYDLMILSQKERLPQKAKRAAEPVFIWIEPPLHDSIWSKENDLRSQFGRALASVASLHENTHALKLKKGWDESDRSLYNRDECRFTAAGLISYWKAVDKTMKYANTLLLKKWHPATEVKNNTTRPAKHGNTHRSDYRSDKVPLEQKITPSFPQVTIV